jgi:hypothetical protein
LFRKTKDSSQFPNEIDIERNNVMRLFEHIEYLKPTKNFSYLKESPPYLPTTGTKVLLVKGIVCSNSPITIHCPILAKGINCHRVTDSENSEKFCRPKLLVKNHGNPNLQLWSCKGCKNVLIKVNLNER